MLRPSKKEDILFRHNERETLYYLTNPLSCMPHIQKDHILAYVYSGELWIQEGDKNLIAGPQSTVFIRRNHLIRFLIKNGQDEKIQIALLVLNRNVLIHFYQQLNKAILPETNEGFKVSFLTIPSEAETESFFLSLIPYINSSRQPIDKIMELKLTEAIHILLHSDKRVASTLFDFAEPWKLDILDFMNNNFMYDLSIKEIALYTGRSVATFKRDFKKISELSPQKWIIKKRLEYAQQKLKEGKKVSDIYLDLGFISLSHFSTAYKREYGIAPTRG
ncbi:AraC family transcriptional regulator [Sporocytophaga myxococcoides]|uniref:AraC family transcriptional regulator n=1 Tax=Sporocytophaga myxococcoides TaxID=153721 RepID=A0A098LCX5_9BACT|nr:AraC family transcriptional regulator [Sporocytophaga myxococcoides]GAL84746.1 AraC family transcriptional regulator [Sporocytophaga myxococcoides]